MQVTGELVEIAALGMYAADGGNVANFEAENDRYKKDLRSEARAALEAAVPHLAPQPDMCHNGHPFEPGVDTDMVFESRDPDPRWCNTCGEARLAPQQVVDREALRDALLIVDGYDVVEGDEVPERELWAVVEAARKMLETE